jgi:HAD superfamily hydrolase (TIGR01549 family)
MSIVPTLRAILFDLDDTLYDFGSFWKGRLQHAVGTVAARDPRVDRAALEQAALAEWVLMEHWPDFLRRHGIADEDLIAATHAAFQQGWFDGMTLPEDTAVVLQTLRARFKIGLITNGPSHIQRHKIERFGLAERMDLLVVSGEFGSHKPDPAIFRHAVAQLGVAPGEALFVGDSLEHDLRGAAAAGLPFVWFNRYHRPLPDDVPPPVAMIERIEELLSLVT